MSPKLEFTSPDAVTGDAEVLIVVGHQERLLADDIRDLLPADAAAIWPKMVADLRPRDAGDATATWRDGDGPKRVAAAVVSDLSSRHNCPSRPDVVTELVQKCAVGVRSVAVLLALDDDAHDLALGAAVARAFPLYSAKGSNGETKERTVRVAFQGPNGAVTPRELVKATAAAVRTAARLVDTPTAELGTDELVEEARQIAAEVGAKIEVIAGEALRDGGFGGLWGVGKAAARKPALVVLTHEPEGASHTACWIGKGIVYDTGGLSLKRSDVMAGMKCDMGGAAAILAAFGAAARVGFPDRLHAVLCLAENSMGPDATRPDDILTMYSGKTVEVNNTDAEGRLVLADGLAYAVRHLSPDVVVDMATLTGAQMIATGMRHAAVISDNEELEGAALQAGRRSGDLVHALTYCPELYRKEFDSKVADMKNSVATRMNAQTSCAAQFIAEHRGDYEGPWLHVDIAGPVTNSERGTGFGVALLMEMFAGSGE